MPPKLSPKASLDEARSRGRRPPAPARAPRDFKAADLNGPDFTATGFTVVGIGASAGGLEASTKLVSALQPDTGMAFILVQHLDPTHESMMVNLLASHTAMPVLQPTDGMRLQPDHLYVIPPGTYLAVAAGAVQLSKPQARRGARLPFDFLLHSLAEQFGPHAIGVVLSGTGADGSVGLQAVRDSGGHVIVQDPEEAAFGGMPRSAIATGAVDLVLRIADIPAALARFGRDRAPAGPRPTPSAAAAQPDTLSAIIELLRANTVHNFSLYKRGTLQRRVERRMGMAAIQPGGMDRYLELLRTKPRELDLLATDLLINVTSFFRDPKVFAALADSIIPDLVRGHASDQPLRVWVPGCSTGEETFSLAMLFREQIAALNPAVKLQMFASDVDPDAVAVAREGHYPPSIEAEVSPARLARFFAKEDDGYRVLPELRAVVVFTVQDVLADPPFSRLDMVSCRNLLIYLGPEAQAKVLSVFHFALRPGGILVLGSAETAGLPDGRFEPIAKAERIYRHIGRGRPMDLALSPGAGARVPGPVARGAGPARPPDLGELGRRALLSSYAPAAILINHRHECLFMFGRTDRYLRVAPGRPTYDLLLMAPPAMRTRLRTAIQRAIRDQARVVMEGGRAPDGGRGIAFDIAVHPIVAAVEPLLLVCFVEQAANAAPPQVDTRRPSSRVGELERELDATRSELEGAIHDLELSSEEQKAINEEALSVNEEYQSANEELLTSKEELQSLNEELTALNSQLQETLERQRLTSNDLQNVLYSTDVATLFLDQGLNIRFFTPATKSLFAVIPTDIGRPLADLSSLTSDDTLLDDARTVLRTRVPRDREVEGPGGSWYARRILPYRTQDDGVAGVVVTFSDITERRRNADALEAARREAEVATIAKSRFLAAASHDLRQPLQTLSLIRGLLAQKLRDQRYDEAMRLVERLDKTADAMSGMLNALLDINQIEAGTVHPQVVDFPVASLLDGLAEEFSYLASQQGLVLRSVRCGLSIRSDPRLLEQMLRNLLSNALKYTKQGKVLLGCRRAAGTLRIEVWDTGYGIPASELKAIFDEYHQLDNAARERSKGLGLGLSIVHRLGRLLGHRVTVRSTPGKGSVFSIDVPLSTSGTQPPRATQPPHATPPSHAAQPRHGRPGPSEQTGQPGTLLVVEDDPEVRELLLLLLEEDGHRVVAAPDGSEALKLVRRGTVRPDLVLADYNLPNDMSGLQLATTLRAELHRKLPVIILTGDISTSTLADIGLADCVHLDKPVRSAGLTHVIRSLLPRPAAVPDQPGSSGLPAETPRRAPVIFVVDDNSEVRESLRSLLESDGRAVDDYPTAETFLAAYRRDRAGCLLLDACLPGMSGLDLLERLRDSDDPLPAIMITGNSDVHMAVQAMKAGASDFIEKPIGSSELRSCIERALEQASDSRKLVAWQEDAASHVARLSPRQRQIMERVLAGQPSKNIAADLGISQRTVENHRAAIMLKTGARSLPALARLALAAGWSNIEPAVV